MRSPWSSLVLAIPVLCLAASPASATVIDFTSGTVTFLAGGTAVTNNVSSYQGVDFYEEDGFRLEFFFSVANPAPFSSNVGNYYNAGNDVIHAHWDTGDFGQVTEVRVSRIDGDPFDLNYFVLTSNTDTGGAPASGNEIAFITSSFHDANALPGLQLAPENWGFPATQIFLDNTFDDIDYFRFYVTNAVDCFGMDNFFIDEEFQVGTVPEPTTILLVGSGIAGAMLRRRRSSARKA